MFDSPLHDAVRICGWPYSHSQRLPADPRDAGGDERPWAIIPVVLPLVVALVTVMFAHLASRRGDGGGGEYGA